MKFSVAVEIRAPEGAVVEGGWWWGFVGVGREMVAGRPVRRRSVARGQSICGVREGVSGLVVWSVRGWWGWTGRGRESRQPARSPVDHSPPPLRKGNALIERDDVPPTSA